MQMISKHYAKKHYIYLINVKMEIYKVFFRVWTLYGRCMIKL